MKKFVCFMLAALMLVLGVACGDGGSGNGNDDPAKSSGELTADGVESVILHQWEENAWYATDWETIDKDDWSYDDLKSALAAGGRWEWVVVTPKAMRSFNGKKATKISFTVESDRDVVVIFAGKYNTEVAFDAFQKVELKAGVSQNITLVLDKGYQSNTSFQIRWYRTEQEDNRWGANSDAFTSWTAAVYKITNLKCYIEE